MNRDELIAAMRITAAESPRKVTIKGWGEVYVRSVTVAEIDAQEADTADDKNKRGLARGAARIIVDENGKRLFDPDDDDDVKLLQSQPWRLLRQLAKEDEEKN